VDGLLCRWKSFHCEACNRDLHGDTEWRVHLLSRAHRKRVSRKRIHDEYKARMAAEGEVGAATPEKVDLDNSDN
jgi:hypothetical protein